MSTDAPAAGPGSSTPAPAAAQPNPTGVHHGADSGRRDGGPASGVEDVVCRDTTTWFDGQGAEAYDRGHRIFRPGVEAFVYTSGSVPVDLICFRDDRYPQAVLSHVWHQHHNMRPPLINWLRKFALDSQNYVWTCAAQAAGVLCWVDFPGTFNDLIEPAARAEPPPKDSSKDSSEPDVSWDYRLFAAVALD